MAFKELITMKKSLKHPEEGDVFVLQPQKNLFYFGKVIRANLKSTDSFINGMTLIYMIVLAMKKQYQGILMRKSY